MEASNGHFTDNERGGTGALIYREPRARCRPARRRAEDRLQRLGLRARLRGFDRCRRRGPIDQRETVKVIVDPDSLALIDGTEVDFVKDGLNEMFRFRNPNVKGECGCGESFNV